MKVGAFGLSELHPYIQAENSVAKHKWLVLWQGSKDGVRTCTWYKWKDGSRDPQIWGLKVPSVLLVSALPGTNLGVVMVMGVGRGTRAHWDSDKARITELISWLTALMRIFCHNQVLSSMSCYHASHQISVSPLLTALDVTKPGQPVPPQIHPVYLRWVFKVSRSNFYSLDAASAEVSSLFILLRAQSKQIPSTSTLYDYQAQGTWINFSPLYCNIFLSWLGSLAIISIRNILPSSQTESLHSFPQFCPLLSPLRPEYIL